MAFEGVRLSDLLRTSPEILLTDVMLDYDIPGKSFWYCNDCGRVYVFRTDHQMHKSIYLRQDCDENADVADILKLRELYFFTDRQVEEPTETDFGYTLKAFLDNPPHPYRFFITCDSSKVYAYNATTGSVAYCYVLESEHNDEVSAEV